MTLTDSNCIGMEATTPFNDVCVQATLPGAGGVFEGDLIVTLTATPSTAS